MMSSSGKVLQWSGDLHCTTTVHECTYVCTILIAELLAQGYLPVLHIQFERENCSVQPCRISGGLAVKPSRLLVPMI
jgi:hypothetical protein